jgi:chemotaxis protein MotB
MSTPTCSQAGRPAPSPYRHPHAWARFPRSSPSPSALLEEGRKGAAWSVPWSDLMMVMFILFLVLFIFTNKSDVLSRDSLRVSREATELQGAPAMSRSALVPTRKNMAPIYERLDEELSGFSRIASVSMSMEGDVLVALHGDAFFAPGEVELSLDAFRVLQSVARVLFLARNQVIISGFSDFHESAGGAAAEDMALSAMRAVQVVAFFTREHGLVPEMFMVQGYGAARPLVPATEGAMVRNQRVEITITGSPV